MIASTELLNWYNFTESQIQTWISLLEQQGISLFIVRINSFSEWRTGTSSSTIEKAKRIIEEANNLGIEVAIDLHTWYTTWDNYFRDTASNVSSNRSRYITYVEDVIDAFSDANVYAFMVMNEPQARRASSSENQFILNVIQAARARTSTPIGVRFMGGYSPTTGHYSSQIDVALDIVCRNSFWDARNPDREVYGCSEQDLLTAIASAHSQGKELWITEFGRNKSNREDQRSYVAALVNWAKNNGVDAAFCWASQPSVSGESYNIFTGFNPHPAFYELTGNGEPPPPPPPPEYWFLDIHHSGEGDTEPPTGLNYQYDASQIAIISAEASEGWIFSHWELNGENIGSDNPVTIQPQPVGSALHLMAIFTEEEPNGGGEAIRFLLLCFAILLVMFLFGSMTTRRASVE